MRRFVFLALLIVTAVASAQNPSDTRGQPQSPAQDGTEPVPVLIDDREPGTLSEPLPPPDLDYPGVESRAGNGAGSADARTATEAAPPSNNSAAPLPEKVPPPGGESLPDVTIRTDEKTGDVVEEYRENGQLTMVRVTPLRGPPYMLLDTNGDGRLDSKDGDGPVRPIYWTIYEWD